MLWYPQIGMVLLCPMSLSIDANYMYTNPHSSPLVYQSIHFHWKVELTSFPMVYDTPIYTILQPWLCTAGVMSNFQIMTYGFLWCQRPDVHVQGTDQEQTFCQEVMTVRISLDRAWKHIRICLQSHTCTIALNIGRRKLSKLWEPLVTWNPDTSMSICH